MHKSTHHKNPQVFDIFFEMGLPETASPFLTKSSRNWGANLTVKASILAAVLLFLAFILQFSSQTLGLSNFLLLSVYFLAGIPSLIEAIEDTINLEINIDVLMTLAAFSSVLIGSGLEGGLLLVLFALSGSMEDAVTEKAKGAISTLHKLSPSKAVVVEKDGSVLERSVQDISLHTHILIKSGEIVPLDGIVIGGCSSVNLVHLTGENIPVPKEIGDSVPAGAHNHEGALTLKVTHTSANSTLSRIIQLVTQAQEARPVLQRWFDRLSTQYATAIILSALFFALVFPWAMNIPYLGAGGSVYRSLAFLIAASPCALIIAIPIAYLSALSICAKKGILLKGGIMLDALANCSLIAFDKTGTLTLGKLSCLGIEPLKGNEKQDKREQILAVAAALERNAVHPIAEAICAEAEKEKVMPISLKDFRSIPGSGLEAIAITSGEPIKTTIGHENFIRSLINTEKAEALKEKAEEIKSRGELLAVLLLGNEVYLFRFLDSPRPKIKETIAALKKNHWRLLMLTGDHENNAKRVATELGIDEYFANLRPEDKLNHVTTLSREKGLVMVGDGINDAPALARATVGIGMGKVGSAAAIEAADIILLHDNLELLDWLTNKARQTQKVVRQNIALAAGAILIAVIPALSGLIPLWLAVVLHEGGTVLVGLNALRLLRK